MFDAVVLAGGTATRLGGVDKPGLRVGDTTLLDRVLHAVADAGQTVVVGPQRATRHPVIWAREHPVGGGPVAAIEAGMSTLRSRGTEVIVLLAADLPWIAPAVRRLLAAVHGHPDAAVLVDSEGRRNYLAAAWSGPALERALALIDDPAGVAARRLYDRACVVEVADDGEGADCDSWDDVVAARQRAHPKEDPL